MSVAGFKANPVGQFRPVAKEAGLPVTPEQRPDQKLFDNLSDLLLNSPFAGANLDLERVRDYPRGFELE